MQLLSHALACALVVGRYDAVSVHDKIRVVSA